MEYTIAQHLAIAIFNDDWTGICGSDEIHAEQFLSTLEGYLVPLDMEADWRVVRSQDYTLTVLQSF